MRDIATLKGPSMSDVLDESVARSVAKLWPHREHESNTLESLCCRVGLHRWKQLDLTEVVPDKQVDFCFWCSKVRVEGVVYDC